MDWSTILQWGWSGWVVPSAAAFVIASGCVYLFRASSSERYKRGARIVDGKNARLVGARLRRQRLMGVTLAHVAIPFLDETKHFKLIGTTGTGKSTAIREILTCALARGDRAVIADPDRSYLACFHNRYRGDVILNPFEPASVKWDLFSEIRNPYDAERIAAALIPRGEDTSSREWRGYARTFLTAVIRRCHQENRKDSTELWRLLAAASLDELRPIVAGTPAQPFLDPDNARMFSSIRSVTLSSIAAFEYIQSQRATAFSVRQWISADRLINTREGSATAHGVLFIPYTAQQIAALRSLIATWVRLAIFETMRQVEDRDQRLWFVIDELDALGAIDGLKDALARLRKFGGRCILGFQSIAQVSSTYGAGDAQTIVENCGNTLILRCSGSENGGTSQFASRLIGEREIARRHVARGRDREALFAVRGSRRSTNISEQRVTEAAVMPSEIEQLPDLRGYLKRASCPEWLRVCIPR